MIRDATKSVDWYNESIDFDLRRIQQINEGRNRPSSNPSYRPQYVYELTTELLQHMLRLYSRGDPVVSLLKHFSPLLDAWEESERLGATVWSPEIQASRHAWSTNQDFYIRCFWLVGLAFALDLAEADWQRLLVLIGNEGQDALLDRVIAKRQPTRKIGTSLCHPKQYQGLLDVVYSSAAMQPSLLRDYVSGWYASFDKPPKKGLSRKTNLQDRPYWYDFDKYDGTYFGFWCIEAVAVVKAFGVDDTLCLGLPNYPSDLLRPTALSTHPVSSAPPNHSAEFETLNSQKPASLVSRIRNVLFTQR